MSSNSSNSSNESQCYFVQLQFDSYMDGDLSDTQTDSFLQHINSCDECAKEFRYAQTVQDGLLDLPLLDCSEATLDQIYESAKSVNAPAVSEGQSWWAGLAEWLSATPPLVRYAFPALAVALIGLITLPQWQPSSNNPPQLVSEPSIRETLQESFQDSLPGSFSQPLMTAVEYSPADIAQAMQELNLAIEYLNQVSQRTEAMVGDRFLITPLRDRLNVSDRLNASFERVRVDADDELAEDQIF